MFQSSMYRLFLVASNSFKEILRKKLFIVLISISFFVVCMSLLLGQLSLGEQVRLTLNFGLATQQISLVVLAIFLGSQLISQDLDNKALSTIFVRPIPISLFFLGRYLGLSFMLLVSSIFLSCFSIAFFFFLKIPISGNMFISFFGMYLESLLILAFVFFFFSYSNSFLVLCASTAFFIIGHFLNSLSDLLSRSSDTTMAMISKILIVLPNLERVNWKSAVIYNDSISLSAVAGSALYILAWLVFILCIAFVIMENKDYN